jgi:hypothetical protein
MGSRDDGPGVPSPDDPLAEANVAEARQVIERLPTPTALWMRDYLERLQDELGHRRRWECWTESREGRLAQFLYDESVREGGDDSVAAAWHAYMDAFDKWQEEEG